MNSAGSASAGVVSPQVSLMYQLIKAELGEERGSHALPKLGYGYGELEPHILGEIMTIHHTKHHQVKTKIFCLLGE